MSASSHNRRPGRAWTIALVLIGLASGLFSCGCFGGSVTLVVLLNRELSHLSEEQTRLTSSNRTLEMQITKDRQVRVDQLLRLRLDEIHYAKLLEKSKKALPEGQEVVKLIRQNLEDKRAEEQKAIVKLQEIKKRNEQTAQEWQEKTRRLEVEGKEWSTEESNRVRQVLAKKQTEILELERELARTKAK